MELFTYWWLYEAGNCDRFFLKKNVLVVEPNVPRPSTKLTRAWSRQWETSVRQFGLEILRTRKCFYLLSTAYFDPGLGFENQCLDTGIVVILSKFRPVILFGDAEQYKSPKYSWSSLAGVSHYSNKLCHLISSIFVLSRVWFLASYFGLDGIWSCMYGLVIARSLSSKWEVSDWTGPLAVVRPNFISSLSKNPPTTDS